MNFLFNLFNHSEVGQRSLEDVIGIMGKQLRALGHNAVWQTHNRDFYKAGEGYNVIVEGFTEQVVDAVAKIHGMGARFIILATEEPTPRGFNHGTQREMVLRQKWFPEAAKFCDGIIHLVPGKHVTDWYGQFAPTAYTELGYAPSLVRDRDFEPDHDFGFYGSLTPRRHRLLKRLARACVNQPRAVKIVADFKTQAERDHEMRRCKVVVQLRKFEAMGLVSSSRCNTALCLGRPVVAEPHDLSKPWDEIVRFAKTEESFISECLMVRAAWRGVHRQQFDVFRTKLPPEECIGQALAKIGITEHRRVAA